MSRRHRTRDTQQTGHIRGGHGPGAEKDERDDLGGAERRRVPSYAKEGMSHSGFNGRE